MALKSWHPPAAYTGLALFGGFVFIHSILEAISFVIFLLVFLPHLKRHARCSWLMAKIQAWMIR